MKNILTIFALVFVFAFTATAQTAQTNNAAYVGYSFYTSDVEGKVNNLSYDKATDAHGVNVGYTRFFAGDGVGRSANTIGFTTELGANFNGKNEASLVTLMGGLTAQARNQKYVQPYARVMAGVGRQSVRLSNISDFSDVSPAYLAGAGLDFNFSANSRYKARVGVDYINTGYLGQRDGGAKVNLGIVF